ncbi:MAG: tetratricopeptide repeat protein [Candidatus Magasanikbacteria bacterium]|nr:tetratricopeptide repeat protein [Candidatus Magasanikbacteria bacterium]
MSEKPLVRILKIGVLASFVMPMIVMGQSTIFPFVFAKAIYFRVLVELIVIAYAALILWHPAYRPRRTFIFYTVWALMLALIFSSIFGVDFTHSFWGNYERMSGVFTIVHFAALMVISASVFRTEKDWVPVWRVSLVVGLVVGITGLNFLLPDDSIMKIGGGGTLGNLIYLANYVMFTVIIAWYVWRTDTNKFWRYTALAIGIIGIAIMMYNGKRGPFIGLLAGGFIGVIAYALASKEKHLRQWCFGAIGALLVISSLIFALRDTKLIQSISVLQGLTHITLSGGTAETRFIAWEIAWKAFKEYPVFGWGSENFYYAFNKFYNPKSLEHGYYETWFDRSHNIFFDYLAMNGIIGFLLYISVFVALFYTAIRVFRKRGISLLAYLFILIFFSAFASQSVFVFDHLSSFLLFFLLLAFADSLCRNVPLAASSTSIHNAAGSGSFLSRSVLLGVIAVIMLWMVGTFNIREFNINNNTLIYQRLFNGRAGEALANFTALVKGSSAYSQDVSSNYAQAIMSFLQDPKVAQKPELQPFWQLAIDGLNATIQAHPLELNGFLKLAEIERMGVVFDPAGLDNAEKYYEKALALSPKRQQILYSWTRLKMERKDYDGALKLLDRAIADNLKIGDSYWYKAIVLVQIGKKDEAVLVLKQAFDAPMRKLPLNFQEAIFAADLLTQFQEFALAVPYYEQALKEQPQNAKLLITLANVYTRLGAQDKAKEMLDRAQLADPKLIEELKKEVEGQKK